MSATKGPEYIIRRLQLSDCEEVREIWTDVGFNIIKYINEVMINYKTNGVFVAQELKTGKLIGVLNGFNISPELAFFGQYIVRKDYQGMGIGSALWERGIAFTGAQKNLILASMPAMCPKYRDLFGFKFIPEKRILDYTGIAQVDGLIDNVPGITSSAIKDDNIKDVIEYDKHVCNGVERSVYINHITKAPETVSLVVFGSDGSVQGYCLLVPTVFGSIYVGPVYADNETIAELLIGKCLKMSEKTKTNELMYSCWDVNTRAVQIAKKLGLEVKQKLPILFTKEVIEGDMDKIYTMSSRTYYPW